MSTPPVDESAAPAATPSPRRLRWPSSAGKRAVAVVTFATALLGLVTGVLALVDKLQDDPEPERVARLVDVTVEPLTFGASLARQDLETDGFSAERLACPVAFLNARVATTGYEGARLPVRWQLFSAEDDLVAASREDFELRPTANRRELDYPLAIPLPDEPGDFYAVVRVIDENGQVALASHRTPEFHSEPRPQAADCGVA
jgi:hypothetical protein